MNADKVMPDKFEVTLGGKVYPLKYTMLSFIKLEKLGRGLSDLFDDFKGMDIPENIDELPAEEQMKYIEKDQSAMFKKLPMLIDMLWAGIITTASNSAITPDEVANMITFDDFMHIQGVVMNALVASLPKNDGAAGNEFAMQKQTHPGTGAAIDQKGN